MTACTMYKHICHYTSWATKTCPPLFDCNSGKPYPIFIFLPV